MKIYERFLAVDQANKAWSTSLTEFTAVQDLIYRKRKKPASIEVFKILSKHENTIIRVDANGYLTTPEDARITKYCKYLRNPAGKYFKEETIASFISPANEQLYSCA